jgi:hypothetical protein
MLLKKTQSHGKIGEAAAAAKCWMHGIAAYSTGGLRSNFAGSDLIVDTPDPRRKLLVQVKAGYARAKDVYLTQCGGEDDLTNDKFVAVGNAMTLSISVPGLQQTIGPFQLTAGVPSAWSACLYP